MVRAGSKTVSAITPDCGVGRGNGFEQEIENPIFGPFGGVGVEQRVHAQESNDLRGNVQGRRVQRTARTTTRGPKRANKGEPRLPERPQGLL